MKQSRVKTLDGKRTSVEQINLGNTSTATDSTETGHDSAAPASFYARCRRWLHNANLVMAGMYTGLTCHGTPHTHHSYKDKPSTRDAAESKADVVAGKKASNRPI